MSGVERLWDTAYAELSGPAARLYRLLAHHPGETFTLHSATALSGRGPEDCQDALEELDRAGLLDLRPLSRTQSGQMRLPGPLRAHALRRSRRETAEGRRQRGGGRGADAAGALVRPAGSTCRPVRGRLPADRRGSPRARPRRAGRPTGGSESGRGRRGPAARAARAARWLDEERHVLFACSRLAHGRGMDAETVALSEPVWTHALDHPTSPRSSRSSGAPSTRRSGTGNAGWLVRTRCQLARPLWESGS
ncbi:hypothetical protein NKH77_16755 [Streptomyces sp. M19]